MKTMIAAFFALTASIGFAQAQEAPQLIGDLSANVDSRYNDTENMRNVGTSIESDFAIRDTDENAGLERDFPERYTGR